MTDRELMQQALDALEEAQDYTSCPTFSPSMTQQCAIAAVAIRARLEQNDFNPDWDAMAVMVEEQQRMAKRIEELEARLAQPEPEPVAWGIANTRPTEKQPLMMVMLDKPEPSHLVVPLYTAPPQREWQGLTEDDALQLLPVMPYEYDVDVEMILKFAEAIETKLKENNNG